MESAVITPEEFVSAARDFIHKSNAIGDGWKWHEAEEIYRSYLKKDLYIESLNSDYLRGEYVIFYHLSYGVPAFSFNIWDSSGVLLTLDQIRDMAFTKISKEEFYSVVTQQEHPLFQHPYFIMHPCHTPELLGHFKDKSKNIIVTFLSLITPLIRLELPNEYGV